MFTADLIHSLAHNTIWDNGCRSTMDLNLDNGTCECIAFGLKSKHFDFGPGDDEFKQCMQLLSCYHLTKIVPEDYATPAALCARRREMSAAKLKKGEVPEVWFDLRPSVEDIRMWTKRAVEALEKEGVEVKDVRERSGTDVEMLRDVLRQLRDAHRRFGPK